MPLLPLLAVATALLAGQEPTSATDTAGSGATRMAKPKDTVATDAATPKSARTSWYPTKESRPVVELPDKPPAQTAKTRRDPAAGTLGIRFGDDGLLLQLGFRDRETTTSQWILGIGGSWKTTEHAWDTVKSSHKTLGVVGRIGREFWFAGPGNLTLVGSAIAQVQGISRDSTYDSLYQVERRVWSTSADRYEMVRAPRSRTTGELTYALLVGAGLRLHALSGKAAFFAGVEAGPGWTSTDDEPNKISHSQAAFLEPSWKIGLDWCF